jgi:SOS-response transcriptional repressor LexA
MKPMKPATLRVYEAFERLYDLNAQAGTKPPGLREIAQAAGLKSKGTTSLHIQRLVAAGWIVHEPGKQHTYVPIKQPRVYYRRKHASANSNRRR